MTITSEDLLAGPRGRDLCLRWALSCSYDAGAGARRFADATRDATFHLSREAGFCFTGVVASSDLDAAPDADEDPPWPSAAEVAALLPEVPVGIPDDTRLLHCLWRSVDDAAYWQPPDGDEALAATPEMRAALVPVAEQIARASGTAWWSTPVRRDDQWLVDFAPGESRAPAPDPATLLATWRWREASGGLWWSVPPQELARSTRALDGSGPVGLALVEAGHGWDEAVAHRVSVAPDARILEIDDPGDWAGLARRHPVDVTSEHGHDWDEVTGRPGPWVRPDWSRVAEEYDGVHLTVTGYLSTAGRAIDIGDGRAAVLAGWDPDQTYWLTDAAHVTGPAVRWVRGDQPIWTPAG
ncbi:serine/threonine-protein kinase [Pseudonocardia phyllosphaerae]|uniref:hypothetical protein n=1 Tax=Pseudonocardia phyllosphaerae TaxID=3390502 RepID=UPI003978DC22